MALQPVTIRLEPDIVEAVAAEAARKGISSAEFMRTAILTRVAFSYARRWEAAAGLEDLYEAAEAAVLGRDSGG